MANVTTDNQPEMQGDLTRPADAEQNTAGGIHPERFGLEGRRISTSVQRGDEEIILKMEGVAEEKALPAMPFPDVP